MRLCATSQAPPFGSCNIISGGLRVVGCSAIFPAWSLTSGPLETAEEEDTPPDSPHGLSPLPSERPRGLRPRRVQRRKERHAPLGSLESSMTGIA
jgi:hypothetical protein